MSRCIECIHALSSLNFNYFPTYKPNERHIMIYNMHRVLFVPLPYKIVFLSVCFDSRALVAKAIIDIIGAHYSLWHPLLPRLFTLEKIYRKKLHSENFVYEVSHVNFPIISGFFCYARMQVQIIHTYCKAPTTQSEEQNHNLCPVQTVFHIFVMFDLNCDELLNSTLNCTQQEKLCMKWKFP